MDSLQKHSLIYLFGRVGPAILTVVATSIFTRMAPPEHYAVVVLSMSAAQIGSIALFQWLRSSLTRFHHLRDPASLTKTVYALFVAQILVTSAVVAAITLLFVRQPDTLRLVLACLLMLIGQAWFDLCQEFQRARLQPIQYGLTFGLRSVLGLALGFLALSLTSDGYALAAALLASLILSPLIFTGHRARTSSGRVDPGLARELLHYGLPLGASALLTSIGALGDRFILAVLLSPTVAGLYGPSVDLGRQTLLVLFQSLSLASLPLVLRALEDGAQDVARRHLKRNVDMLLWIALPAAVGFAMLHREIANLLLGQDYRAAASELIPYVALSALLTGLRTYYFDQATQLARNTKLQIWVSAVTCVASLALMFTLIPILQLQGAAIAAVGAQIIALIASILIGSRVFPMPFPIGRIMRSVAAVSGMAAAIALIQWCWSGEAPIRMAIILAVAGAVYGGLSWLLDAGSSRSVATWLGGRLRTALGHRAIH